MALAAAPAAIAGVIADLPTFGTVADAHSVSPSQSAGSAPAVANSRRARLRMERSGTLDLDTTKGRVTALAILKRANPLKDGDAKPPVYGIT